jgi:hypothetical protein
LNRNLSEFDEVDQTAGIEMVEMTTKFSGIIFRKAELEGSFEKVYSRVIEKMVEFQFFGSSDGENLLEIFGEAGG